MSAGSRRNGSSKFGPFYRFTSTLRDRSGHEEPTGQHAADGRAHEYTGRHAIPRDKATRKRVSKVVPVAAAAAALAAGAASYGLAGTSKPEAAQLNTALILPVTHSTAASGAGHAKVKASSVIQAAAAASAHRAAAKHAAPAKHTASASATAAHSAVATHSAPAASADTATAAASKQATTATSATQSAAATLSCDGGGLLPMNVTAIVSFLLANGYSHNAAAGIAGNIYQESKGNPESEGMGGGGLIGWTPLPSGFVTGNASADLQTQLSALLTYNQGWSGYLPALNSASSPASAAYIYVTDFERAGIPAASTREQAATDVASACGI